MNLQVTRRLLAGFSLVAMIAIVVGCTTPSSSLSPTGPTAVVASSAALSFSPNPSTVCELPSVLNPETNECEVPPPPPPPGVGCSPGYWKNHESAFLAACDDVPGWTCDALQTAITCKGSDASCRRNEAARALNEVSGCTESD